MIQFGRNYRYQKEFGDEVAFPENHGFEILQLWYDKNGLCQNENAVGNLEIIKLKNHPVIIHALSNISEYEVFTRNSD